MGKGRAKTHIKKRKSDIVDVVPIKLRWQVWPPHHELFPLWPFPSPISIVDISSSPHGLSQQYQRALQSYSFFRVLRAAITQHQYGEAESEHINCYFEFAKVRERDRRREWSGKWKSKTHIKKTKSDIGTTSTMSLFLFFMWALLFHFPLHSLILSLSLNLAKSK